MEPDDNLELRLDAAAPEPPGMPPSLVREPDETDARLNQLVAELETLSKRQEILLFLATSPHSRYQQEAEANLEFLTKRITGIEKEIHAICFPRKN